jgi:hypothetical protein
MISAAGIIVASAWLGVRLMLSPEALIWINQFIPDWIPISITGLKPPQTLAEIRQEMQQAGKLVGEPLVLGNNTSFVDGKSPVTDLLLPVSVSQSNCQPSECERLVELRLYQSTLTRKPKSQEPYFQLVNQLPIAGVEESFAIAPIVDAQNSNQGSARMLPLAKLTRFAEKSAPAGVWLNLSGQWRGNDTINYGQVLHYNPRQFHLSVMLNWTSLVGQEPVWQNVTGDKTPELVVNQTIGIEPQFKIYQVKPVAFLPNPFQLEPILILEDALNHPRYETALVLARSGLWTPAWDVLQELKQRQIGKWSAAVQAQADLIRWHAQATKAQADQVWASPNQQILANLVDGRWGKALTVFEASADNSRDALDLLKTDRGRLQKRISAALRVNPSQREVKIWQALLLAAQQNRLAAIAWLKKQPKTTAAEIAQIDRLISRLDEGFAASTIAPVTIGQVLGAANPTAQITPAEWLKPKANDPLKLENGQVWYTVQVARIFDGKRWQTPDAIGKLTADAFWKLLNFPAEPPLQINFWLPDGKLETTNSTLKAIRFKAGIQLLLATNPPGAATTGRPRPLASTDAIQWLNPEQTTLATWVQQQPDWAKKVLPLLTKELARSQLATVTTWEDLNQLGAGNWQLQLAPLTGQQPDILLTVPPNLHPPNVKPEAKPDRSRTVIFSAAGKLIYSELTTEKDWIYRAIVDVGTNQSPALVVDTPSNYTFLRWSAKQNRFE